MKLYLLQISTSIRRTIKDILNIDIFVGIYISSYNFSSKIYRNSQYYLFV